MPYYLKHFFDPDFDYEHLAPKEREDGSVDHRTLGYVQNVVKGDVLAEWQDIPNDGFSDLDPRHVHMERTFPMGANTEISLDNPDQLQASANGYVFVENGLITVKKLLNVRRDVDYHTGNIAFVGEMVIHGSVRTGFELRAASMRIKGSVDGAGLSATHSIVCETGVKGQGKALLEAGGSIKCGFSESATLKARDNVLVEGSCLHGSVYAGGKIAVKGRLTGVDAYCFEYCYVGEQLGGGMSAETNILAGYDPMLLYKDMRINKRITLVREEIRLCDSYMGKQPHQDADLREKKESSEKQLGLLLARKAALWERVYATEQLERCRVIVPGVVKPGVEISIGPAYFKVDDFMENVRFIYKDREIHIVSPAIEK